MTIRIALTVALVSGVFASGAFAQDQQSQSSINAVTREQKGPRPNSLNLPTSPILPMTNPIAPMMTAPVQPFVRYQGPQGTPTVVIPPATTEDKDRNRRSNRNDNNVPVVIVGGGGYLPYYDSVIYQPPLLSPAPVPGQLPNTYPVNSPDPTYVAPALTPGVLPPAPMPPVTTYYPDSNVIITPEPQALTVERGGSEVELRPR